MNIVRDDCDLMKLFIREVYINNSIIPRFTYSETDEVEEAGSFMLGRSVAIGKRCLLDKRTQ